MAGRVSQYPDTGTHHLITGFKDDHLPDEPIVAHVYRTSQMELDSTLKHTGRHSDCLCGLPYDHVLHVSADRDALNHKDCTKSCCMSSAEARRFLLHIE